jgi:hypothetical protein
LRLLTSGRTAYVAGGYGEARAAAEKTEPFAISSAAEQVYLYKALRLFTDNVDAALEALRAPQGEATKAPPVRSRVMVFAGHRVDSPGRTEPRFPPASEPTAREMIERAVAEEKRLAGDEPILGFAAGASGGDILFHEVCAELGIPTTLLLPLPDDQFAAASVADGGPRWLERFRTLTERLEVRHLAGLPDWLAADGGYTIWQRGNRWILHTALSLTDADIALIVLWDGKGGDGPGGTENMVNLAKSRGVKTVHLPASELL